MTIIAPPSSLLFSTPKLYTLVAGSSEGFTTLNAFDSALLEAKIGNVNLVRMSSILPPLCQQVSQIDLPFGALVPVAYASKTSSTSGITIASAVAVAKPENEQYPGVIMEYSAETSKEDAESHVKKMAEEALHVRKWEIKEIESRSISLTVEGIGATFAAVVLWY